MLTVYCVYYYIKYLYDQHVFGFDIGDGLARTFKYYIHIVSTLSVGLDIARFHVCITVISWFTVNSTLIAIGTIWFVGRNSNGCNVFGQ